MDRPTLHVPGPSTTPDRHHEAPASEIQEASMNHVPTVIGGSPATRSGSVAETEMVPRTLHSPNGKAQQTEVRAHTCYDVSFVQHRFFNLSLRLALSVFSLSLSLSLYRRTSR